MEILDGCGASNDRHIPHGVTVRVSFDLAFLKFQSSPFLEDLCPLPRPVAFVKPVFGLPIEDRLHIVFRLPVVTHFGAVFLIEKPDLAFLQFFLKRIRAEDA